MAEVTTTKKKGFQLSKRFGDNESLTLIQNAKFAVAHNSSSQHYNLALSNREKLILGCIVPLLNMHVNKMQAMDNINELTGNCCHTEMDALSLT